MGSLEVVDDHRICVVKLGSQSSFALESAPALVVLGDLRFDQLEGTLPLQHGVLDPPDLTHPTVANFLLEQVFAENQPTFLDGRGWDEVPVIGLVRTGFWRAVVGNRRFSVLGCRGGRVRARRNLGRARSCNKCGRGFGRFVPRRLVLIRTWELALGWLMPGAVIRLANG